MDTTLAARVFTACPLTVHASNHCNPRPHLGNALLAAIGKLARRESRQKSMTYHRTVLACDLLTYRVVRDRLYRPIKETTMLRAEFDQRKKPVELKLEGRLVGPWAVQVKSLVSRHFVAAGLLVDISEVTYVDSVGEQLLCWLRDLHASFVAETCYARDLCERLHLMMQQCPHRASQAVSEECRS